MIVILYVKYTNNLTCRLLSVTRKNNMLHQVLKKREKTHGNYNIYVKLLYR